jgi:hypothetical protein
VMPGEHSQRHRSELAPGGAVVAFTATTIIALLETVMMTDWVHNVAIHAQLGRRKNNTMAAG